VLDPTVEATIPAAVRALAEPEMFNFTNGILIAVMSSSERVQAHVNQGLNHLHGGWDFEASRHFAAAMREDPECLLAQWGMVMTLLTPSPETGTAASASVTRLLDLLDKGNGSPLERGYGYALIKYIQKGPVAAADAFRKVSREFPNDMQSLIFTALFNRGGYDDLGSATPDQITSEKALVELVEKYPSSSLPVHTLLQIRAEAPDLTLSLTQARKLCEMTPNYPPYLHLLGHYEWRCGNHAKAIDAFAKACAAYQAWMLANHVSIADSPGWVKSECYRITALSSKGEAASAYSAAMALQSLAVPTERINSTGNQALLWDAKTLPARLLLNSNQPGDAAMALKTLPSKAAGGPAKIASLAEWLYGGLTFALETVRLIEEGKSEEAQAVLVAYTRHTEEMAKTRKAANLTGDISPWNRSFAALNTLASDLRARLAMAGPAERRGTAYNWFSSAAERQKPDAMMFAPVILTPIWRHVAEFYVSEGRLSDAVEYYQRALMTFPNDMRTLEGLKQVYKKSQLPAEVEKVVRQIDALRAS
jgi:tetratricopeptide (TPR) repeat protein